MRKMLIEINDETSDRIQKDPEKKSRPLATGEIEVLGSRGRESLQKGTAEVTHRRNPIG